MNVILLLNIACITGLVWCGISDLKTQLIPDAAVVMLLALGLFRAVRCGQLVSSLIATVVVFLMGCLAFSLGGMGGGDVKLMSALAAWFGIPQTFYVLFLATVAGIVWGLIKMAKLGILKDWFVKFRTALVNVFVLRSLSALVWDRLPEEDDIPSPPKAIPFGACLAAVATLSVLFA